MKAKVEYAPRRIVEVTLTLSEHEYGLLISCLTSHSENVISSQDGRNFVENGGTAHILLGKIREAVKAEE